MAATIDHKLVALALKGRDLSAEQANALERFGQLGLPRYKSEDYQRTDLSSMLDGDWTVSAATLTSNIPAVLADSTSQYVRLGDLARPLPSIPSVADDPLAQLTIALSDSPEVLYISKQEQVAQAIDIRSHREASCSELTASRLIVFVDEGAEVELVYHEAHLGDATTMALRTIEVYLARGAKLRYTDIEHSGVQARRISSLHLYQQEESEAYLNFFSFTGGQSRNNYYCDLHGEGAHLELGGMVISSGEEHVDNFSYIAHSVPRCTSDEKFKYVLMDRSYGVFMGRILVAVDAQKTEAYQNNRNLLLSADARMQAKPQLEIYADDVKCSHGMTTGQLDEDALFYMRQRGIAVDEARRMLSVAFSEDVLQRVERVELRDELRGLVEQRFQRG